jgi:adenylosuccinate synthase
VRENVDARNHAIKDSTLDWKPVFDHLLAHGERLKPWVADTSLVLHKTMAAGKSVLFEGAQATLLDIDHGTYPFVTSSNASAGGVCTGLGVPPRRLAGFWAWPRPTRPASGEGPLPTELLGDWPSGCGRRGRSTAPPPGGRAAAGWYDAVVVRYSARINGLDALALTKLDVLDGLPEVKICTGYKTPTGLLTEFPADLRLLANAEPVYDTLPGWSSPTKGVTRMNDLPREAQRYLTRLEEVSGAVCGLVSTGSDRRETIIKPGSVVEGWMETVPVRT